MSPEEPLWYLPGENQQPSGPFRTDDVLAKCRTGGATGATLCWCDGMQDWKPLAEVPPFREALAHPGGGKTAAQSLDNLGKKFNQALDFTRRKAKVASLHIALGKQEKQRLRLLSELGAMLYPRASDVALFSQEPYAEKLRQIQSADQFLESLRQQIQSLETGKGPAGKEEGCP